LAEKLTERQKKFCEYYVQSLNASEAAKKAGYSEKTAGAMGYENLKKPEIQEYIETIMKDLQSERVADAEEVLQYLTDVMRGNIRDRGEEASIESRTRAAELLGKRYKIFVDRREVEASVEAVTIVNDIPRPDTD
jgi:phage terminase small subunit